MTCPDCERHKLSASLWRNKAYEVSGTPLPLNPEELLRKEYERGRAAGAAEEREACAEMTEGMDVQHPKYIAAAIRARSKQ